MAPTKFLQETDADLRIKINAIMAGPPEEITDALMALMLKTALAVGEQAAGQGYRDGRNFFVVKNGEFAGALDVKKVAADLLARLNGPNADDIALIEAALVTMTDVEEDMILAMLTEERERTAKIATSFPLMARDAERACEALAYCIGLIQRKMPAAFPPVTIPRIARSTAKT